MLLSMKLQHAFSLSVCQLLQGCSALKTQFMQINGKTASIGKLRAFERAVSVYFQYSVTKPESMFIIILFFFIFIIIIVSFCMKM